MNKKIFILWAAAALAAPAAGRCAGTAAAPFLRSETTARVSGMGGAAAALTDDAGAAYFNPAGLAYAAENRFSFTTWNGLDSRSRYAFLSAIYDTGRLGVFNLSYLNFNSGSEDVFDLDGNKSSLTLQRDYALGLGWGHELLKGLSVGGQVKLVSSELAEAYKDKTGAVDAGLLARTANGRYSAGAGVRNAGGELKYLAKADPLPRTVYAGVSGKFKLPSGSLLAAFDVEKPRDQPSADGRLGVEYALGRFALRAGLKRVDNDNALTFGGGVRLSWLDLDYGFEPGGDLDEPVHKFTVNVLFGGAAKAEPAAAPF